MASPYPPVLGYQTPDDTMQIDDFFSRQRYSPPPNPQSKTVGDVKAFAISIDIHFDDLNPTQQIKLSFLVLRHQHDWMRKYSLPPPSSSEQQKMANVKFLTEKALDANNHPYGKKLNAYVVRVGGGDLTIEASAGHDDVFEQFLQQFSVWRTQATSTTIVNQQTHAVDAFVRYQDTDSSMVCYIVAAANAAFYSKYWIIRSVNQAHAVKHYALNVSRFMRNRFTEEEIYKNIFVGEGDGSPEKMLRRILKPSNPNPEKDLVNSILFEDDPGSVFYLTRAALNKQGALILEDFQLFTDFKKSNRIVSFSGLFSSKSPVLNIQNRIMGHTMLIVGVRRTNSSAASGGVEFLVQNTWQSKPFVVIGWDLLQSMGIQRFLAVPPDLNFHVTTYNISPTTVATMSGASPPSMDFDYSGDDSKMPSSHELRAENEDARLLEYWQEIPEGTVGMKGGC